MTFHSEMPKLSEVWVYVYIEGDERDEREKEGAKVCVCEEELR